MGQLTGCARRGGRGRVRGVRVKGMARGSGLTDARCGVHGAECPPSVASVEAVHHPRCWWLILSAFPVGCHWACIGELHLSVGQSAQSLRILGHFTIVSSALPFFLKKLKRKRKGKTWRSQISVFCSVTSVCTCGGAAGGNPQNTRGNSRKSTQTPQGSPPEPLKGPFSQNGAACTTVIG